MKLPPATDWFELCLDKYPNLPSVVLIRSLELKFFPRELLRQPVLDLCCGDGFFASCLGIHGAIGCDIDPRAVEAASARKETFQEVVTCDARSLAAFPDNRFNTVFSNCALEHVDGIDRALTSVSRVLRPGGRLIMTVPDARLNDWFFPARLFRFAGFARHADRLCAEYARKQQHINIDAANGWGERLAGNGFFVERAFHLFSRHEYGLVTFFESFVLDGFPGPLFRVLDTLFRRTVPVDGRKRLWRRLLKPVYLQATERPNGGELFLIARKPPLVKHS